MHYSVVWLLLFLCFLASISTTSIFFSTICIFIPSLCAFFHVATCRRPCFILIPAGFPYCTGCSGPSLPWILNSLILLMSSFVSHMCENNRVVWRTLQTSGREWFRNTGLWNGLSADQSHSVVQTFSKNQKELSQKLHFPLRYIEKLRDSCIQSNALVTFVLRGEKIRFCRYL